MRDGPRGFNRDSSCPDLLRILLTYFPDFAYGALTLFGLSSQIILLSFHSAFYSPSTPNGKPLGLGSFLFARRYLGNRSFFLFLQLLRCFSSLRLPLNTLTVFNDASLHRVPPFGYLRVLAYLRLSVAFRGSSRPSSASSAQAFTVRPSLLDLLPRSLFSVRFHNLFNDCLGFFLVVIQFSTCISHGYLSVPDGG